MRADSNPALVVVDSSIVQVMTRGLRWSEEVWQEKDTEYTMFRSQDASAWIAFSVIFAILILFDNCILHRSNKAISCMAATLYTLFWVLCAFGFCGYIWYRFNEASAFNWMSGYLLEWMLSFDNLFVFHLIFQVYKTPDDLKHKPLFWGICGAIFFRLLFLFIGEYLMHTMFFAHIVFGVFLIYTGVKSVAVDDEDEDPSQNPVCLFLSKHLPFVGAYDTKGSFFVDVPVDAQGRAMLPEGAVFSAPTASEEDNEDDEQGYGSVDFGALRGSHVGVRTKKHATMLFLVVVCLEVSDILFAVDSVSAIVAQVPDLYLAYTAAVFAMLGLRAMFFIVDELVKLFQFLKYGVAAVLVFIGVKLCIGKIFHIPPMVVCFILFATLGSSMLASVAYEKYVAMTAPKGQKFSGDVEDAAESATKKA